MSKLNAKKLDSVLLDLGHQDRLLGTEYIRIGAALYDRSMSMTQDIYPAIAAAANSTPSRVERAMRHSIQTAWMRGNEDMQLEYFGYTVDPRKGTPTVGEYLARIARLCRED